MILHKIEIPQFITEIELTKTRRAKKDAEGKITNKAWLNKPRTKKINGQDLWVGINPHLRSKMGRELKIYMYDKIKHIGRIEQFPIAIDMIFYMPISTNNSILPDIDNIVVWYRKCLHDALAGSVDYIPYFIQNLDKNNNIVLKKAMAPNHQDYPPLIPDDNIKYIQEANTKFVEVASMEDRKLEIIIRTINE